MVWRQRAEGDPWCLCEGEEEKVIATVWKDKVEGWCVEFTGEEIYYISFPSVEEAKEFAQRK